MDIPDKHYFRIGEVARILGVAPHVLRFWEGEFRAIRPEKSSSGQRVYARRDVERLLVIRRLLREERYTIEGARRYLREHGLEEGPSQVDRAASLRVALVAARAKLAAALVALERLDQEQDAGCGLRVGPGANSWDAPERS
jgi:DNA-binding transcriptional MerR regulator